MANILTVTQAAEKGCPLKINLESCVDQEAKYFGRCDVEDCMSWHTLHDRLERPDTEQDCEELSSILRRRYKTTPIYTSKDSQERPIIYIEAVGQCTNPKVTGSKS